MLIKTFPTSGQYAKKVMLINADLKEFGVIGKVMVLTRGVILEAVKVAEDYQSKGRLSFGDTDMLTYQELQARMKQLESTGIEQMVEIRRISALVETAEALLVGKQFIIEGLEADTTEYAEFGVRWRKELKGKDGEICNLKELIGTKNGELSKLTYQLELLAQSIAAQEKENCGQTQSLVKYYKEVAFLEEKIKTKNALIADAHSRNWWQRLFKVGK